MTEGETLQIQFIRDADTQERGNIPYMTSRPHPEDLLVGLDGLLPLEVLELPGKQDPKALVALVEEGLLHGPNGLHPHPLQLTPDGEAGRLGRHPHDSTRRK